MFLCEVGYATQVVVWSMARVVNQFLVLVGYLGMVWVKTSTYDYTATRRYHDLHQDAAIEHKGTH